MMGSLFSSDEEDTDENNGIITAERVTGGMTTIASECPKFNISYDCPTYSLKLEMLMVIDSSNITYRNDLLCFSRNMIRRLNGTDINPVVIVGNQSESKSSEITSVDDFDVLSFQDNNYVNSLSVEDIQWQISTFENYISDRNKTGIVLLFINDATSEDLGNLKTSYSAQQSNLFGISYRSGTVGDKKLDIITSMRSCTYKRYVNTTSGLETVGEELDEIACNVTGYLKANCPLPPSTATSTDMPLTTTFTYSQSTSPDSTDFSALPSTHVAFLAGGLMICVVLILLVALFFVYRKKMESKTNKKGMKTFSSDPVYNNEMTARTHYQPGTENVDIYNELQHRKSSVIPIDVYSHSHKQYTEVESEMYDHTNVQNLHPSYNESDVYDHAQSNLYGRSNGMEVDHDIYDHSDGKNKNGSDMYDSTHVNRINFDDLNLYASTQMEESM